MRASDFIREIMVMGLVTFYKYDEVCLKKNVETSWQNMVAAFLYSLLLALIAFTLAYSSVDPLKLMGIEIRALPPPSPHMQEPKSVEKPT